MGGLSNITKLTSLHHIFGWLQVEKIIKGNNEILNFLSNNRISHHHGTKDVTQFKNNTICIASKNLTFSDSVKDILGHGRFKKRDSQKSDINPKW